MISLLTAVSWTTTGRLFSSPPLFRCADPAWFLISILHPCATQLYFIFYVLLVVRAYVYLRKRPFASYRMANMLEMLTWRQQLSTFVLVLLSQVLLGWINHGDCATRMISWAAGLFPINVCTDNTHRTCMTHSNQPPVASEWDHSLASSPLHAHHPL